MMFANLLFFLLIALFLALAFILATRKDENGRDLAPTRYSGRANLLGAKRNVNQAVGSVNRRKV
jgi:hypothetical protein